MEDLLADWDDADHLRAVKALRVVVARRIDDEVTDSDVADHLRNMPKSNRLGHPIVRQFDGSFGSESGDAVRESISGLTNPHWWKQKTQQWRGASTDHGVVGENAVWLCAAGMRRSGNDNDFYTAFLRDVRRVGPARWLPTTEDREVIRIEEKILALDAWKIQVHCGALALLGEALAEEGVARTFRFPAPALGVETEAIGEMTLRVDVVQSEHEELVEAFLTAKILENSQRHAVDIAMQIARAALQSSAEEWLPSFYGAGIFSFCAIVEPTAREFAEELRSTGSLPEASKPGGLRIGLRAHYAARHGLIDAQVEGSSVVSLCGYWFVPTADHEKLETCAECEERLSAMSAV